MEAVNIPFWVYNGRFITHINMLGVIVKDHTTI